MNDFGRQDTGSSNEALTFSPKSILGIFSIEKEMISKHNHINATMSHDSRFSDPTGYYGKKKKTEKDQFTD